LSWIEKPFFKKLPNIVAAYFFYCGNAVDKPALSADREIYWIFILLRSDVCVLENYF